jgi:hypothetical protein
MVSDLDIWRAANLLIRKPGADAELEAARLQDLMLERGDLQGRHLWQRIRRGNRGPASGAHGQAELRRPSIWWRIADRLDFAFTYSRLAVLDWLFPMPRTLADEVRDRDRERLRRAFPFLDERRRRR